MQMTLRASQAVAALVDLAQQGSVRHVSLHSIAARQRISLSHLEHLFARLRRHGLVRASRGPGGGYLLARAAAQISVADVVAALGERAVAAHGRALPPGASRAVSPEAAIAESVWRRADAHLEATLRRIDLQSLVREAPPAGMWAPPADEGAARSPVHPRQTRGPALPRRAVSSVFDLAETL